MTEEEILKKFDDIEQEIITMRNHDKLLLEACTELIQKIKSSFDLSAADIRPAASCVALPYCVSVGFAH